MEETIQAADLVQVIEHTQHDVRSINPDIVHVKELKEAYYKDLVSEEYKIMCQNMVDTPESRESADGIEIQHRFWHVAGECLTK